MRIAIAATCVASELSYKYKLAGEVVFRLKLPLEFKVIQGWLDGGKTTTVIFAYTGAIAHTLPTIPFTVAGAYMSSEPNYNTCHREFSAPILPTRVCLRTKPQSLGFKFLL